MNFKTIFKKVSKSIYRTRNSNKYIALLLVITLTVVTFSGCSPKTNDQGNVVNGKTEERTDLVYGIAAEPSSLDPMTFATMSAFTVTYSIYDTLVELKSDGSYGSSLAEEVIISDDELEYTIPIKKGVKFHDGSELTPEDVVYSIERTIEKGWAEDMTTYIDTVSLDNENAVLIKLSTPFGGMVGSLASPFFSIMSKDYVELKGDDAIKREPMGTGAYKMTEWVIGDHIGLVANEDYFQGAPKIKNISIRPITDKNTGLIALENKEIDVYLNANASDIDTIKANKDLAFYDTDQSAVLTLNMNIENEHLKDERVRKAISYGVNKDDIIGGALEGIGTPANSPIPTVTDGYSPDISYYEHNVEKAKELLNEAGVTDLKLILKIKEDSKNQKVAQIVQANLKEIGVEIDIDVMEGGAYSTDVYSNGDFELTIGSWSAMFLDAYSVVYSQFHKSCYGPTGNITHVVSDELSNLLDVAAQVSGDKKVSAYEDVVKNIYENAYNIPLVFEKTTITTNVNLKGVVPSPLGIYMLKDFSW